MKNRIKGKRFNPKKFARRMLILLVVMTISVFVFAPLVKGGEEGKKKIIVVKQGDTLWSIAARYYPDRDVRKAVYQLKKENNLESALLLPGQKLTLPE